MGGGAMNIDLPMVQFKASSPSTTSSSSSPSLNLPLSINSNSQNQGLNQQSCTSLSCSSCGGSIKPSVHGAEDKSEGGSSLYNAVLGSVPSKFEVESAIASLQSYMDGISSSGLEMNQLKQILENCDARTLILAGCGRIREALLLLQTDPSFKRMVVSLSSDGALWNAAVNNEMVRKALGDSCVPDENCPLRRSDEAEQLRSMVGWILDIAKAKVIELMQKFQSLIDEVFQQLEKGSGKPIRDSTEKVDDKIASSLLLSVVILLVVVLARAGVA